MLTFSSEWWRGSGGGIFVSQCWSLCVEERFYVLWPLLLALWPAHYLARCALIAALTAGWYATVARLPLGTPQEIAFGGMPFALLCGCTALADKQLFHFGATSPAAIVRPALAPLLADSLSVNDLRPGAAGRGSLG